MFFVPFAVGSLAAGTVNIPVVLLLVSSAAVFLSRESLLFWWRARHWHRDPGDSGRALAIYAVVAACAGVPLVLYYGLWGLIAFGAFGLGSLLANAELAVQRQGRTVLTELLAVISAGMNAPAAYYTAAGHWSVEAAWLWMLCTLYFASSIFYVKLRVQDAHAKSPKAVHSARLSCTVYHALVLAALVVLIGSRSIPVLALVAFAPILIRAFAQVLHPSRQLNLKKIGWLEVSYSAAFVAAMVFGFTAG